VEYKLVKISNLSGEEASIYSLLPKGSAKTLFDSFIVENKATYLEEVKDIYNRIKLIGSEFGVRDNFLKLNEGVPGDGVCALYDEDDKNLRLYAIKFGKTLIVLGNGGYKPKTIRALQEDKKLEAENKIMKDLSHQVMLKMKDKELKFSDDYMSFEGDLDFTIE
jgi:hypothetical protein